ncbi:MAG: thioredoxin-like domain-containing protein [Bacteroidales bacterium]
MKQKGIAKKICITAICANALLMSFGFNIISDENTNKYHIKGDIKNIPDSTVFMLMEANGNVMSPIAMDTLHNGIFSFSGDTEDTQKLALIVHSERGFPSTWLDIWVAPGKDILIKGADNLIRTWKVSSDIPEQNEKNRYSEIEFPEKRANLLLMVEESELFYQFRKKDITNEQKKNIRKSLDSLRNLQSQINTAIDKKVLDFLEKEPVTNMWMESYSTYVRQLQYRPDNPLMPKIKSLYSKMSDEDRKTETGIMITEYMNLPATVKIGDNMVDGKLFDTEGNSRSLSELKGKYILLDFWSSGCGPCIQSFPESKEVEELYKDSLSIVTISEDPKDLWLKSLERHKLEGLQWNEFRKGRTGLAASYGVKGIPHYVLISPDGKIIDSWSGYSKGYLKNKVSKHLNQE